MRNPGREVPDVTRADIIDEVAALRVDDRDPGASGQHVPPSCLLVPVHFPNAARREPHVDGSQGCRNRQFTLGYLPRPPALGEAVPGSGK